MTDSALDPLRLSRKAIRLLSWLNLAVGGGIVLMLAMSFHNPEFLMRALKMRPASESTMVITWLRTIMALGLLSIPLAHLILMRLRAIVDTVQSDPFIRDNAARLRAMGWGLLGLEVLHLGVGAAGAVLSAAGQPTGISWSFSATRWLAVLMLFVLARVFEQGTHLRDDLEGTV